MSNKSSSVDSQSSDGPISDSTRKPETTKPIPIASIKQNRKLTLGEIQKVHDCTLIDNKLAFIVTLRATNCIAKVFRTDINTNSLRHAVPFSSLCHKHGCDNVSQLEQHLLKASQKDGQMSQSMATHPTIEISCDAATSLKQLASIASVVSVCNSTETESESEHSNSTEDEEVMSEGDTQTQTQTQKTNVISYNLRSKKRKFRELNDSDNKTNKSEENAMTTNNSTTLRPKYKRPNFLRPTPNTISVRPSLSPKKAMSELDISNGLKTMSAPNTPVMNRGINNRQIIDLINSPNTRTLQFPQISLPRNLSLKLPFPQKQTQNSFTLFAPNINSNGVSAKSLQQIQQLQQLVLLQKKLGLATNMSTNCASVNNNGIITQITNLNPIQTLPRLESESETKGKALNEPPTKKRKLANEHALEPFWTERLRLDGILNTHKTCEKQMKDLDSMRNWTHIIRTLQGQRLELAKVQQSICMQWQSYHIEANRYNLQLQQIITANEPKNSEYKQLKSRIDEYKKQISEIYEKISKLSVKRKVFEKQLLSANAQLSKTQISIQRINGATKQFKQFIGDRKEKATKLVHFMRTIDVISKQYCASVEAMQKRVSDFEPHFSEWNSGEVVTWFENIDKGLLNKSELFLKFKTQLITNNVSGKDLVNLNDFSLKMMGLRDDHERAVVIKHLNSLLAHSNLCITEENESKEEKTENNNNNTNTNENETELK